MTILRGKGRRDKEGEISNTMWFIIMLTRLHENMQLDYVDEISGRTAALRNALIEGRRQRNLLASSHHHLLYL